MPPPPPPAGPHSSMQNGPVKARLSKLGVEEAFGQWQQDRATCAEQLAAGRREGCGGGGGEGEGEGGRCASDSGGDATEGGVSLGSPDSESRQDRAVDKLQRAEVRAVQSPG